MVAKENKEVVKKKPVKFKRKISKQELDKVIEEHVELINGKSTVLILDNQHSQSVDSLN